MKKTVAVKTEETDSSTEIESLVVNTPRGMSDHEIETTPSVSVTSEEVTRQFKAVTVPPTRRLAHLCGLMKELRIEQAH